MCNWRGTICLVLAFVLTAHVGVAQPPGRGNQFRDFFRAMREVGEETGSRDFGMLLHHPAAREEIGLDEAEFEEVREVLDSSREVMSKLMQSARSEKWDFDRAKEEIRSTLEPIASKSVDAIKQRADFDRLVQLYVQMGGIASASNPHVAEKIQLSGEDLDAFRANRHRIWDEARKKYDERIKSAWRDPAKGKRLMQDMRAEVDEQLSQLLTKEQRDALESLKGEPFDDLPFGEHRRGGGRPGPPQRGGGPGPGPGKGGPPHRPEGERGGDHRRERPDPALSSCIPQQGADCMKAACISAACDAASQESAWQQTSVAQPE